MDYPLGLSLLAEEASSADQGVDIIAVHGLGHAFKTWTRKDESQTVLWLRDWLPADLPSARIFTYSYHSSAFCNGWGIIEAADKLLNELKILKAGKAEESRPFSFICHSLGGLVVKCALSRAFHNRGDESLHEIVTATQGIIFLGTPHSTSSSELYSSVAKIAIGSEPTEVTMVAARFMQQILIQFMNLPWDSLPWRIVSFYEELPLPGSDSRAVDRNQTELWTFPQVSLPCCHHDMCRFTADDDPSYVKVLESLRNITLGSSGMNQVTVHPTLSSAEHEVLKSLAFEDVSTNVRDASRDTCDWIFEHNAFKSWLVQPSQMPSQMLWVTGKAGAGKSTLLKHMVRHNHAKSTSSSTLAAYFFFSHRGANQSMTSLLRSLLYQLLKSNSSSVAFEIFARFTKKRETLGSDRSWNDDVLMENFLRFIDKSTALGNSFCFFIDALDECEDPDGVVSLFQRLNTFDSPGSIRTCLSSRHSPSIIPAWEIRMEDNNFFDIRKHVNDKLVAWQNPFPSNFDVQELIQAITEKAQGVFLWAALVVSHLLRDSCLKPFKAVQHSTWWLPTDLEAGYETVLGRLRNWHDAQSRKAAQDALILVLCAKRPLSIFELRTALEVAGDRLDHEQPNWAQGRKGELEDIHERQEIILPDNAARLAILGGGLLEVWPQVNFANGTATAFPSTVQFIHESVREFLLDRGSSALETPRGKGCKADFHFRVAQICLTYINETLVFSRHSIANEAASSPHFLRYAVTYGMQHLSLAARMGVKPKTDDIWQSPPFQDGFVDRWAYLRNKLLGDQNLFKPRKTKASHVMSYFGLPWLDTGLWGGSLADIDEQDHRGKTPLYLAAAMGHVDLCRALIQHGAELNHRDHVYGQTPLSLAAAHGHQEVVRFLLRAGADFNNYASVSALWMAAHNAHLQVVRLLLEAGASAGAVNVHTGETALSRAAALGHTPIVSLLLESGAKVESWDKRGWTPLHHAVSQSRKTTLELLLGTLKQDQLHVLRIGLVKARHSWVDAVLRAIILGLCFRQCGQSQAPPSGSSQQSKTPSALGHNKRTSAASSRKRDRRKLDSESDKEDWEEEDQGASEKRPRYSNLGGRRFACPYHKRNAAKYPFGACNGKGFENIHRLKSHLKTVHSRVLDWQRCHICQARFIHDEIASHEPCVKREKPTDYEDGFDAVQYKRLVSKETFPGKSSEEKCWYTIFKVLFPDWPETKDIPSPYQDDQNQTLPSYYQQAVREFGDVLTSSDTISEILSCGHRRGKEGIRQILERHLGNLTSTFGLPSIAESEQPHREPAADSPTIPRTFSVTRPHPRSTTNVASPADRSHVALTPLNIEEARAQSVSMNMGNYQGSHQYLPVPEQFPSQRNPSYSYDGSFDPHSSTISSSGPISGSTPLMHNASDSFTANTAFSDSHPTGSEQWGTMDRSGSPLLFSQHVTGSAPQPSNYPHPSSNMDYALGTMCLINNQGNTSSYIEPSVPSALQQQQRATPMEYGQNNTVQLVEPLPGRGNDKADSVPASSRADEYYYDPASQA